MLDVRNGRVILALVACLFSAACATSEDETAADRRVLALEEDNASLKKQIEDLNAVEGALSRELDAQKGLSAQNSNGSEALRTENERLRGQVAQLEADLNRIQAEQDSVRPAAAIDSTGLSGSNIEVVPQANGEVIVRVGGNTMFNTASDTLTSAGQRTLNRIGQFLRNRRDLMVSVEGHTDATPLGKTKAIWGTNMALSLARAMAVQDYLRANQNVSEKRMRVVGYGQHQPLVAGNSKSAHARNRRVEIVLYKKSN